MPTHQDETLPQRYAREYQDYLKLCGSMTAEQVADLQLQLNNSLAREQALQQRLTSADERADNRDSEIFAQVQSALRRSFSLGQIYWQQADSDSTCQQNKSDQTMEVQEQHILNVLKSLGAALKPAEGVGDDTTLEEDREDFKKVFVRINTKQGQSISLADMIARYEKKP